MTGCEFEREDEWGNSVRRRGSVGKKRETAGIKGYKKE
jgi:hypothetical protein